MKGVHTFQAPSRRRVLQAMSAGLVCGAAQAASVLPGYARPSAIRDLAPPDVDPELITRLHHPLCAEPALDDLVASWITPARYFYVLNHGSIPHITAPSYRLRIDGAVHQPLTLGLDELMTGFARVEVTATLTCAGNRRQEHSQYKQVHDPVQWHAGAIGNARWSGVRLADLLRAAGLRPDAAHVCFEGLDATSFHGQSTGFGGSIPLSRVFHPGPADVLVAYEMNGKPLPRLHGYPVRVVVPGYVGARSVKWLGCITVRSRPSDNPWFQHAYRLARHGPPIYHYPLNAAIGSLRCAPTRSGRQRIHAVGYALAPGQVGRRVARVEVSADHGRSWHEARLDAESAACCWRLWRTTLEVAGHAEPEHLPKHLIVRAIDTSGRTQPRRTPWNPGGYLYNGWHAVALPQGCS